MAKHILIVDDNATNRKLLRVTLEAGGYSSVEASDGVEALALLEHEPVDVVVSDILMPRMDGYRLCCQIRKTERWRNLPFIICTSTYTSATDENLALQVGADRYIRRPAPAQALLDAIEEACAPSGSQKRRAKPLPDELDTLREYSGVLVRKLEERNVELERAQKILASANQRLEECVKERTAELQAANRSLEAFVHTVSHDLGAPVRHIRGFAEIVIQDTGNTLTAASHKALNTLVASAGNLTRMIEALFRFSRVGCGGLEVTRIKLSEMVLEVRRELETDTKGRQILWKVAPLPEVMADAALLRQTLVNLLGNAVKYTRDCPTAEIEIDSQQGKAGQVVIFIRDNGVGFDMSYASELFGPFKRLHPAEQFEGAGIGLATVRRIIERHGGIVWAESRPGQGATFYFSLPGGRS